MLYVAIKAVFVHQINLLKTRQKIKLSEELKSAAKNLLWELIDDQLLLTQKSVYAIFNVLLTEDLHLMSIFSSCSQQRLQLLVEMQNKQSCIARVTGHCWDIISLLQIVVINHVNHSRLVCYKTENATEYDES